MDKIEPLDEIVTDTDDDFSLDKITNKEFKKFNTERSNYNIVFKNTPDNFLESIEYLTNVIVIGYQTQRRLKRLRPHVNSYGSPRA